MNLENQLALSYYQEIAVLNEEHHISVVQHRETKKIYVKKLLTVYNGEVYRRLQQLNLEESGSFWKGKDRRSLLRNIFQEIPFRKK